MSIVNDIMTDIQDTYEIDDEFTETLKNIIHRHCKVGSFTICQDNAAMLNHLVKHDLLKKLPENIAEYIDYSSLSNEIKVKCAGKVKLNNKQKFMYSCKSKFLDKLNDEEAPKYFGFMTTEQLKKYHKKGLDVPARFIFDDWSSGYTLDDKKQMLSLLGYRVEGAHVIAHKAVHEDMTSIYDGEFAYEVGETVTSDYDPNPMENCSHGISAWSIPGSIHYASFHAKRPWILLELEIDIKDMVLVDRFHKIRTGKAKVLRVCNELVTQEACAIANSASF